MSKKEEIWKEEGKMFNEQFSMLNIQFERGLERESVPFLNN